MSPQPILLASTSPQRRAILTQLRIPFELIEPCFEETGDDPIEHAVGKARSVLAEADGRPVLGVDTVVRCDGDIFHKPDGEAGARAMLGRLAGRTHEVVSGLCLVTPAWEETHEEITRVTFRPMTEGDVDAYVALGEWDGRAGAYAIQGAGAALVERIEGDYLNVVGLPVAVLVAVLARRFAGQYGFGS